MAKNRDISHDTVPLILLFTSLERFSVERRKTKNKVITLANHRRKQHNEPIRIQSKYMQPVLSAGKRVRARHGWFSFGFLLVEKLARVMSTNHRA